MSYRIKNEPFMNHIVLRRARRADIVVLFLLIIFLTAGCNIGRRSAPVVDEFALPEDRQRGADHAVEVEAGHDVKSIPEEEETRK